MMVAQIPRGGTKSFFEWFVHSQVAGSLVLLGSTVVALIWANTAWRDVYEHLLHTRIGVSWGTSNFDLSLHHWINDGLMVVFFFVVGLEIKRELLVGQLSSFRRALLPIAAGAGGMLVPAVLYAAMNLGGDGARGWGIPMATDIAFALGALAVLGSRVPIGLKVFVTALAIADDLGAVLVIALFYTDTIRWGGWIIAGISLALLLWTVRIELHRPGIQFLFILGVWAGVFVSGIHATVAGILVALVVPVKSRIEPRDFFEITESRLQLLKSSGLSKQSVIEDDTQLTALVDLQNANRRMTPTGLSLEKFFHPTQALFILPLFALFNAGVQLRGDAFSGLANPVSLGVILGLVLGKPAGIFLFSWLAIRSGQGKLPDGVNWGQLLGAGFLCGIGFTMSLFVTELAFSDAGVIADAKIGILLASLVAAAAGFLVLQRSLPSRN